MHLEIHRVTTVFLPETHTWVRNKFSDRLNTWYQRCPRTWFWTILQKDLWRDDGMFCGGLDGRQVCPFFQPTHHVGSSLGRLSPQQKTIWFYSISKSTWRTSGLRCYRKKKKRDKFDLHKMSFLWRKTSKLIFWSRKSVCFFSASLPWVLSPVGPPQPPGCQWCSHHVST